jgi:SAM-dependent methyltransferase
LTLRGTYDFSYSERSPYGHAVSLIRETVRAGGIVLDLGCGFGAIADAVTEAGFVYVGADIDTVGVEAIAERGFESHLLDLQSDDLADRIVALVDGREVGAITLLDVIEHIADSAGLLDDVKAASAKMAHPNLIVSVPNVGHIDLAAKLVVGRWDISESGLLDRTHLQLFTEKRLLDMLGPRGWVQVAERDFTLARSDQHFPAELPTLAPGTPLHELLLEIRSAADDTTHVNQFVRSFVLREQPPPEPSAAPPFAYDLSVIVRTQGHRHASLMELLTCLAAQTVDSFEILLTVHSSESDVFEEVQALVDAFDFGFARRVRLIHVVGGSRGRPLNVGLAATRGRYVAFVDDDDLVTADWVEQFTLGAAVAPGRIIRSITVEREVRQPLAGEIGAATIIEGPLKFTFSPTFDFVEHFFANSTPICAFAVPAALLSALRIRFDEHVTVQEDWHFLMRCASYAGVHDTGAITAIYHRWATAVGSRATIGEDVWRAARDLVLHEFDTRPVVLPPGAVRSIIAFRTELEQFRVGEPSDETTLLLATLQETQTALAHERGMAEQFLTDAKHAQANVRTLLDSRSWRVTRPLRALQRLRSRHS